ncbi:MAG: homoserine dehydrogenase [Chloroflexota bacterium]
MPLHSLALLGVGHVGQALARLLQHKSGELLADYRIEWRLTGVASRRLGWLANPDGLDPWPLLQGGGLTSGTTRCENLRAWFEASGADVLFEMTALNAETGQPAIDHLRATLERGMHAITANKGPIVHAYHELRDLARARDRRFLFESTVMDGAPVFSLFRETLPAARVLRFRGVLNSTTNFILTEIETGRSFEGAVRAAQAIGIAETDPSADIDGWDAAVKVRALATVLMDRPLKPGQVKRQGIRGLSEPQVRAARAEGRPFKLVCRAEHTADGVAASVRPEQVPADDPLASVSGTSSLVHFELDVLPGLTIIEHNPGPETTAYGLLADFLRAVDVVA